MENYTAGEEILADNWGSGILIQFILQQNSPFLNLH